MRQNEVKEQLALFDYSPQIKKDNSSTFVDNISKPIHRWFRYSAGFSAEWVQDLINKEEANGRKCVLDPFAGSGTVLIESEMCNVDSIGIEPHPFVSRIAKTKLYWREDHSVFLRYALSILEDAKKLNSHIYEYPDLIHKCFPEHILKRLDSLRKAWELKADGSKLSELSWLVITSILRETSPAGTAQWQYVLPNKSKATAIDPYKAFELKALMFSEDIFLRQRMSYGPEAKLLEEDARVCPSVPNNWADLIITSPPYANNYDYADATRLEMSFWGEVKGWGDLKNTVRKYLIRSCSQHAVEIRDEALSIIEDSLLDPIKNEIKKAYDKLNVEREKHGGRKNYHLMVIAYFHDMAKVWSELRRVSQKGVSVCFVIGDSAPYGIYVPVDRWLGELALAAGFSSFSFEKVRDRNIKWKNRKHRVPLHEGRLWVKG